MSMRYKGGIISATAPTTTTSTASGVWSSENVFQAIGAVAWPRSPAAPTIGTATDLTTGGSVSVPFTAPSDTGSTAITSYASLSTPGSLSSTNSASPITATGLTNSTAYTFQVRATNSAGTGPYSGASNSVTPTLAPNYIEEVFSTYLYTGTNATLTITNGIDLSTKGGLVWSKSRSAVGDNHVYDTARGIPKVLFTNGTNPSTTYTSGSDLSSFNTTGFSLGPDDYGTNTSGVTYASWTFRKQAKFFDIVTYTGNATSGRQIAHSLGSVPGCIIIKSTDNVSVWYVYHRSVGNTGILQLQDTAATATSSTYWNNTDPTSSVFTLGGGGINASGATYVAYLFAHNAGGFGLTGSDNVISCGSYTGNGSTTGPVVTLGYEPQWLMVKRTDTVDDWNMVDNMRGFWAGDTTTTAHSPRLRPNLTNAEQASGWVIPTATGFQLYGANAAAAPYNASGGTYIYIAIRRGPMKVPTLGTSVFSPVARAGTFATASVSTGFVTDAVWETGRSGQTNFAYDRLRGPNTEMSFTSTNAESTYTGANTLTGFDSMTGFIVGADPSSYINGSGINYINWTFRRAPGFFDEVCYTGTGSATTITHNLGVAPELMIVKRRDTANDWWVYDVGTGNTKYNILNSTTTPTTASTAWNNTSPTSSVFSVGSANPVNASAGTYVAYLFATCAGVSKVGTYTGTAALLTVNCSFTSGARFVLIKRTDDFGDWYVWDSARGISSSTDPYLLLNSTAAETTGTNYVDTDTTGFKVTAAAPAGLNASGGTYIFLAIA